MGGNRSRLVYRAIGGEQDDINLVGQPPWNATLLQISIHYDSPVTTPGIFQIKRQSGVNTLFDFVLYSDDPSIDGKYYDVKICQYEFLRGDSVVAEYANPDNIDVGIEIIFREGQ